ncbi:MAG: sulfatase-like hydrolase/transferase [Acidimicrobiales bacterium]|nr:sulfatase-like hydrolase/transferase [Acidimicrobiales bacterium]
MPGLQWRLLHLLAATALAITQPLLSLLGDNPTFFTAHGSSPAEIVWFALVVALGPSLVLAGVVAGAAAIGTTAGRRIHLIVMGALAFVFLIQVVDLVPGPWPVPTLLALGGAVGLVHAYRIQPAVRSATSVLAIAPALFVASFLFLSPTSDLVFAADVDAVELDELFDAGELTDDTDSTEATPLSTAERLADRFPDVHVLILDELPIASILDGTGAVDRARFPNLARLADTADLFTNATTVGFTTERAVPAILTGRYESNPAPVFSTYPENLFTLLGSIYDASESDPLVDLCPDSICNGEPPAEIVALLAADETDTTTTTTRPTTTTTTQPAADDESGSFGQLLRDSRIVFGHLVAPDGLDLGLPEIGATWGDFGSDLAPDRTPDSTADPTATTTSTTAPDDTTTTAALDVTLGEPAVGGGEVDAEAIAAANREFLDSLVDTDTRVADFRRDLTTLGPTGTPRLSVIHALLPHVPWRLHPNGQIYDDVRLPGYFNRWDNDPQIAEAGLQRHLLQLQYTDALIGEYLDRLVETGAFENSIVIVTADHGIGFVPGEQARSVGGAGGGIAGVPIFVKRVGQTDGSSFDHAVETIDIVPTIAALLDIELPWPVDGHDLHGPEVDRFREVLHPFRITIPDPFPAARDEVTDEILALFGAGTDGNLYGRAGLHDRIATDVSDLMVGRNGLCWVMDQPTAIPEEDGAIGYVFGEVVSNRTVFIPLALTVGDVLAGTSTTLHHEVPHRVFALGDPTVFAGADPADIALHEIIDGELHEIRHC